MKIDPLEIPDEGLELSGSLAVADYDIPVGEIQGWKDFQYRFQITKMENQITVMGTLSASFNATCSRCLDPLPWKLEVKDFCHLLDCPGEAVLDLTPLIREDIILALPIAIRCELDSGDKCPRSGRVFAFNEEDFAEKRRATVWRNLDQLKTEN